MSRKKKSPPNPAPKARPAAKTQLKVSVTPRPLKGIKSPTRSAIQLDSLSELLAQAPAAIGVMSGPELRWTYINDLAVQITGRDRAEEFLGKTLAQSLPEIENQGFRELLDGVFRTGKPYIGREVKVVFNRESTGQPAEGYFDFIYQPVRNSQSRVEGVLVHAVEVTERVQSRKAVEEREERLRLAHDAAHIGTWEWDLTGNTSTLSPELHRIFATDPADPNYTTVWASRVHPDDWPNVQTLMQDGYRVGEMDFEYRYCHPVLGLRWFSCRGRRRSDQKTMLGIVQDITARKVAENENARLFQQAQRERKHAEQSEAQFRAIIETTPECVKLVAADGTLLHMNSAGLALIGADSAATAIGKSVYNLIASEDRERFREFNERICRGAHGSLEFDIVGLEGTRRHMETHAAPLQYGGQTVQLGVTRDVTERVRAEELLRHSEEEFRQLANAIPQLVWMARADGWIFWYNQRWYDYTGTTPEQMEGWQWQCVHDPATLPSVMERWNASIQTGEPFEMTFPLRGADGVFRPFLTRIVPVRDASGAIKRWFGTNTDLSSEFTAREQLRLHQERLEATLVASQRLAAIVESSDDAIVSKDLRGIVTSWNRAAERIFGFTAAEMIGQSITKIIPPELHSDETRILQTIARGDKIEHFETVRVTKFGERLDISLTVSPVRDEQGRIIGAAKIARDITQRRKTEQALRLTERLASVGRLAATVAHEINNPLEAVTNFIYLAQHTPNMPTEAVNYLALADRELDRVSHIAQQTLGFYRDTSAPTRLNVRELLEDVLRIFESKLRYKSISATIDIIGTQYIEAIGGEVRQVFSNLISNAIDASSRGGSIIVRAYPVTRNGIRLVRLAFADRGSGIAASSQKDIFKPFFTTKKEVGTGLGLWVSKTIVEKHGGRIAVRSRVGQGTVFTIDLPVSAVQLHGRNERATA